MKAIIALLLGVLLAPQLTWAMSTEVWLEKLHNCENRFDVEKIVDSNGYYSYGKYMWQLKSFLHFGQVYGLLPKDMTLDEARLLIGREKLQDKLTGILYEEELADDHWVHCYKKIKGV